MPTEPLVTHIERYAAAAIQIDRLLLRLKRRSSPAEWSHFIKSNAGITSVRVP